MENIEQKHECGAEDNGCVGHPITNMLMSSETVVLGAGAPTTFLTMASFNGSDLPSGDAEDMPPEFAAAMESMLEDMAGQVERAVDQIAATNTRTAHLVLDVEGLKSSLAEAHGKLDSIFNNLQAWRNG